MPLSPPLSNGGDSFQNGFQHLVQHNMSTSYPSAYEDNSQMTSGFGSPTPTEGDDGPYIYQGHQADYGYHEPKYSQYVSRIFSHCYYKMLMLRRMIVIALSVKAPHTSRNIAHQQHRLLITQIRCEPEVVLVLRERSPFAQCLAIVLDNRL
jgi:hypothetical protein